MKRALFVTGTGTDVGKTMATAALLRALRSSGINAATMKPVQTGADCGVAPDLAVHWRAADWTPPQEHHELMAPYLYEHACSPHLAARESGRPIEIARIVGCAEELLRHYDALLIESAGGLLVPLDENDTMLDFVRTLGCPALVVATTGLGTINHTLLTLQALQQANVPLAGAVYCQTQPAADAAIEADNPPTIERFSGAPTLGVLSFREEEPWGDWADALTGIDAILKTMELS